MSSSRNIAFIVADPEINTKGADQFWEEEFKCFQRLETANYNNAEKLLDEFRDKISLFIVLTIRQGVEMEFLLRKTEGIPNVLIVRAIDTRGQIERLLPGEKIHEPFDSILESWLRKNFKELKSREQL